VFLHYTPSRCFEANAFFYFSFYSFFLSRPQLPAAPNPGLDGYFLSSKICLTFFLRYEVGKVAIVSLSLVFFHSPHVPSWTPRGETNLFSVFFCCCSLLVLALGGSLQFLVPGPNQYFYSFPPELSLKGTSPPSASETGLSAHHTSFGG